MAEMESLRVIKLGFYCYLYYVDEHASDTPRSRLQLDVRAKERQSLIQRIADKIFYINEYLSPDFTVIALCTNGSEDEDEGMHHFVRSEPIELNDELTAVALPVKRHMVKYHEPCSEILEQREAFGFTKMRSVVSW